MHSIFITDTFPGWVLKESSAKVKFVNSILKALGFQARLHSPKHTGLMTNIEQRINMYHFASQVLSYDVSGDFVELGCHVGQSAVLFKKIIEHYDPSRTLHLYDSFSGLPEIKPEDGNTPFYQGQMEASREVLLNNFKACNLSPPIIHEGWFKDTLPTELPEKIAFAHLDGDLYDSIIVSLQYVYPKLSKGAICLIDDYCDSDIHDCWNLLPGVKKACDEFLSDKEENVSLLYSGDYTHGYFRKK